MNKRKGVPTVLVVDDEKKICRSLEILLKEDGEFDVLTANDFYEALEQLNGSVDLVLTDLTMPGKDGLELLKAVKNSNPDMPVIMMTAYSTVESAVEAMKVGANDYLVKPFDNDELMALLRKTLGKSKLGSSSTETFARVRFGDLLGRSRVMQEVYHRVERAAETDSTVLVTGESGTGKELVAKAIHFSGTRKSKPFIALNCTAVPENLIESELFGHEKGAFSGAIRTQEGKFELAEKGTLFLDEIGELRLSLQVKLLRVLQEKEFTRVGGKDTIRADVRIIAATNRDLSKAVEEGKFREDLFYRLNVLTVNLPPLRERTGDITILVDFFLREKCRRLNVPLRKLDKAALGKLEAYSFPGNVRELENLVERAVVVSRSEVLSYDDLPFESVGEKSPVGKKLPLPNGWRALENLTQRMERDIIERALRAYPEKSNTEIAELLGTSRRVLENRIKAYKLLK